MNNKQVIFFGLIFLFLIYSIFVYTWGTADAPQANASAVMGKLLFQKNNCTACHQIFGLGGYLGPELTTVMSQPGKGAAYAEAFIRRGSARMPDFQFSDEEVYELLAFLTLVDSSATTYKMDLVKK